MQLEKDIFLCGYHSNMNYTDSDIKCQMGCVRKYVDYLCKEMYRHS